MNKKDGIGVGIVGLGAALPETVRDNRYWQHLLGEHGKHQDRDPLACVTSRIEGGRDDADPEFAEHFARVADDPFRGARARHVAAEGQTSSELEVEACRAALEDAGITPADVDLLVSFSQVPDYPCPGNHALVAHRLGLPVTARSMTVGADCASFVPAVTTATHLIAGGEHDVALVVMGNTSSQVCSRDRHASTAVGDAAVAVVIRRVRAGGGYIGSQQLTRGEFHAVVRIAPEKESRIPWYRGDLHGAPLVFQSMDPEAAMVSSGRSISLCREACAALLDRTGHASADVDVLVVSQPTVWFHEACADTLGIPRDRTLSTFPRYGHPMPASAPLNLYTAYEAGRIKDGDLVLLYTPGAGFIQAALLMRWCVAT